MTRRRSRRRAASTAVAGVDAARGVDQWRWLAPLADLVCIVTFILAGAGRHQIDEGASWFFTVLWPIAVGWYAAALVLRLYTGSDRGALRLTGTVALGTAVMIVLRGSFTDRPWVSVFTLIYVVWMLATAFGWRGIARVIVGRRRRSAPATPATSSRRP